MPGFLSRVGDNNGVGGKLIRGAKTVIASGLPAALNVSPITPHPGGLTHKSAKTIPTPSTVIIEGSPIIKTGTKTTCGHPIITGSKTIIVP